MTKQSAKIETLGVVLTLLGFIVFCLFCSVVDLNSEKERIRERLCQTEYSLSVYINNSLIQFKQINETLNNQTSEYNCDMENTTDAYAEIKYDVVKGRIVESEKDKMFKLDKALYDDSTAPKGDEYTANLYDDPNIPQSLDDANDYLNKYINGLKGAIFKPKIDKDMYAEFNRNYNLARKHFVLVVQLSAISGFEQANPDAKSKSRGTLSAYRKFKNEHLFEFARFDKEIADYIERLNNPFETKHKSDYTPDPRG